MLFDTCVCNLFFPIFFSSSWQIRLFLYSKGWSSSGRKSWRNSPPWNRLSRRWKPRSELSHDLCIFWCFSSQFQFLALCFLGQPFSKTQSIYLCLYHLFVPCPFSCLPLPLARYASEHGPHGSSKELSKKEPKTRHDYAVQNRGKIHDLEHEPRGWKSRNLWKSQLSVLGVAGIHSLLGATVCWTPKGGLNSFLAEFLTLPARCQKGCLLKLTHLTHEVLKFWWFANCQVVTYLAIFCLKWGRKGEAYTGSDTAVSWQHLELTIGKTTVFSVRFILKDKCLIEFNW